MYCWGKTSVAKRINSNVLIAVWLSSFLCIYDVCAVHFFFQEEHSKSPSKNGALSELKDILMDVAPKIATASVSKQLPVCTTPYLISCLEHSAGLQWGKMTPEQVFLHSSYLEIKEIESLDFTLFEKVN